MKYEYAEGLDTPVSVARSVIDVRRYPYRLKTVAASSRIASRLEFSELDIADDLTFTRQNIKVLSVAAQHPGLQMALAMRRPLSTETHMKKLAKTLGIGIGVLIALILLLVVVNRMSDGPLVEMLAGGRFTSGEIVMEGPTNWSFLADRMTIEFESAGRSRVAWIHVVDGDAFIGASLGFPPFKTWHETALEDPAAVLRVDGKRYPRHLTKIEDEVLQARLKEAGQRKYGGSPDPSSETWYFRLDPPR